MTEDCGMITKERLEDTIRGVIREFKRTKRITDPAAEELTAALEERVEELFEQEATFSYREVEDSADYLEQLRDSAQLESAETFLREILAWQQMHSS
jgi:predicted house-cleaning noncanonical NTP pyrophosphatase (MazG superfamily)